MQPDQFIDKCGIFGTIKDTTTPRDTSDTSQNHQISAAKLTTLGLHALQHRGQDAFGIISFDGQEFFHSYAFEKIGDHFNLNQFEVLDTLPGSTAIGHVRYATSGQSGLAKGQKNVQPLFAELDFGGFALAHNGNLTNALTLRHTLVEKGSIFQSTIDTEVIIHLMAQVSNRSPIDRMVSALQQVEGSFSLLALVDETLIGIRDPYGVRPMILGRRGHHWILTSETCALDIIEAQYIRDINPGEMIVLTSGSQSSFYPFARQRRCFCIFEYIYFSRPDSIIEGRSVYDIRKRIGMTLAREAPTLGADKVIPIPDSGVPAALGYAEESHIPFDLGIIRSHYGDRTFIKPTQQTRIRSIKLKHNINQFVVKGKSIVLIDDSLVRGNTIKHIIAMLRAAGTREVHVRISSPPTTHPCFYGIATPTHSLLIAYHSSVEEIRQSINADSLQFLSLQGLHQTIAGDNWATKPQFCDACFTGNYPIPLTDVKKRLLNEKQHR